MKKVFFYALFSWCALAVIPARVSAQSARTGAEEFLQEVFSRKQQEGTVVVSRKKTENKKAPRQKEPTTTTRESKAPSRRGGGYESPRERRESGGYEDGHQRNRQGGYGEHRQERPQREGQCQEHRGSHNHKGRSSARKSGYDTSSSKSKCGVQGCHHPGKHKGLHKS